MVKAKVKLVAPTTVLRTVMPSRPKNSSLRTREHLTPNEVEKLIEAAAKNRNGHRDALMVLLPYRHGLRASEVVDFRWEQIDLKAANLHVTRSKERHASNAPAHWPRTAGAPSPATREQRIAVCVHIRARRAVCAGRLLSHGRARWDRGQARHQGARAHASPCLRL